MQLLEQDLNFFAGAVINEIFRFMFPQIHVEIWELLKRYVKEPGVFFRLALGLPRGHAKTTLIKLFVVYCILFTKKRFILIVGSTSSLAEKHTFRYYGHVKFRKRRCHLWELVNPCGEGYARA